MPTVASARRSAAMKACIKLYENGELTDHLVPYSSKKILEEYEDEFFAHWKQHKNGEFIFILKKKNNNLIKYFEDNKKLSGTTKMYRSYDRYFPLELYGALPAPNKVNHLYEIVMKHEFEPTDINKHMATAFESESRFGILSSKILPEIAEFPLYMHQGKVSISIKYLKSDMHINSNNHFNLLRNFHVMIFRDILKVVKYFMAFDNSNEENSFLLVPLISSSSINWNVVESFQNLTDVIVEPSQIEKLRKEYVPSEWLGKVVIPWYSSRDVKYMVVKVHENMTPLSKFPEEKYASYKAYVEETYQQKVERTDTFMIEVKALTDSLKFFAPGLGQGGSKKKAAKNFKILLIPELCYNFMFPADLWVKCRLLPSVLYRLNAILIAEKLRISLNDFVGVMNNKNYKPSKIVDEKTEINYENMNGSFDMSHNKNGE